MPSKSIPIGTQKIASLVLLRWSWRFLFLLIASSYCSAEVDLGSDTISHGQQLRDWEFLRSANKDFRLRFFSPGTSPARRYLGIFLGDQQTMPVWVANRNNPINDASGVLMVNDTDGMLSISYSGGIITISSETSDIVRGNFNTSATLQDDGNLVLKQLNPNGSTNGIILWQSFDHPTDTLLPGMKLGTNSKTGQQWLLTSWISDYSPFPGSFTLGVDRNAPDQLMIIRSREILVWASGPWHNNFSNFEPTSDKKTIAFEYIRNGTDNYFTFTKSLREHTTTVRLNSDGELSVGNELGSSDGNLVWCGDRFSIRNNDLPPGCAFDAFPKCGEGHISFRANRIDAVHLNYYDSIKEDHDNLSIIDCGQKCRQNCSCYAYASLYENGTGCEFWDRAVDDMFSVWSSSSAEERSKVIYIRNEYRRPSWTKAIAGIGGALALLISILLCLKMKCKKKDGDITFSSLFDGEKIVDTSVVSRGKDLKMNEIHQFSFEAIDMATNNFSVENKLGEGGFGPVYKGEQVDGQEIAIKRLSKTSSQGLVEFKNEIRLIVKLQHNNLVRLLGCCIHHEEMMLVYDYMPNKSLDFFLFDPRKRELLKWADRMNIVEGIAQGLLYLHTHSRLRVIHRDLKASNILLDSNMTPKISDFGMARIFGKHDSEANTKRIVGTHGYMSPEYAIKGVVSTKIDVFSFGVLILEILSGKKNHKSYHSERPLNLIGLAWELWIKGKARDLIDTTMDVSECENEVQRCINVGLLCVQDIAIDRPSMADVILMLKNELLELPTPKQPAFFIETNSHTIDKDIEESQEEKNMINCTNKLSTSIMEAR